MKLIHIVILVIVASLIAQSDPYGIGDFDPDQKKKKHSTTDTLVTNAEGTGIPLTIRIVNGESHNHPLFAVWVEDTAGNYLQDLYVAKSIAGSVFNYGDQSSGAWSEGVVRRPAALPYWSHKRGIQAEDGLYIPSPENPVPDAYSGPTPKNSCVLYTKLDEQGPEVFYVYLEVNQPWDWNDFWTNNKYPEDKEYKTSSQPAVVYRARVRVNDRAESYTMEVVGHSHYSGKDGSLNADVSTLTTALEILKSVEVSVGNR